MMWSDLVKMEIIGRFVCISGGKIDKLRVSCGMLASNFTFEENLYSVDVYIVGERPMSSREWADRNELVVVTTRDIFCGAPNLLKSGAINILLPNNGMLSIQPPEEENETQA